MHHVWNRVVELKCGTLGELGRCTAGGSSRGEARARRQTRRGRAGRVNWARAVVQHEHHDAVAAQHRHRHHTLHTHECHNAACRHCRTCIVQQVVLQRCACEHAPGGRWTGSTSLASDAAAFSALRHLGTKPPAVSTDRRRHTAPAEAATPFTGGLGAHLYSRKPPRSACRLMRAPGGIRTSASRSSLGRSSSPSSCAPELRQQGA